jgi:hypothetical protein
MALARVKRAARHDAWLTAIAATTPAQREAFKRAGKVDVSITFTPPNRSIDDDNAIAQFKAARDGIADALGVDDGWWRVSYAMNGSGRLKAGVLVRVSV